MACKPDRHDQQHEPGDDANARSSAEIEHIVKWGVVVGWASLGAPLTNKLEQWFAESARRLNTNHERP